MLLIHSFNENIYLFLGFPYKLYEGFCSSIDTHLQLYGLVDCYNQRTITTLNVENFFSSLQELDATTGTGHLTAREGQRAIGSACGLLSVRMNPDK